LDCGRLGKKRIIWADESISFESLVAVEEECDESQKEFMKVNSETLCIMRKIDIFKTSFYNL